jgi:osmotically-inducible protein OsmY
MAQNYRQQNESGRWQDYSRSGQRGGTGRDRFATGNERHFRPDWDERSYEGNQDESFEGDRSYSAGGYPEEFGYRREQMAEPERGSYQRYGSQESHEERFGSRYYEPPQSQGRNADYGSRDFGRSGSLRSQAQGPRHDFEQDAGYRGEDFNRGRSDYHGSGFYGGGSRNYYGPQGGFGSTAAGVFGRDTGNDRQVQQQSYRGRGPKGYERSDERLREMICERLTDDPSIDASEVTVEVTNKVVKLSGTVEERRMKYLVEEVIEQVGGVRDIDNQLRVQATAQSSYGMSSNDSGLAGRSINVGQSGNLGQPGTSPAKRN